MSGAIMRSAQFKQVVEPILNTHFDGVYSQRVDEYKQTHAQEEGIKRSYQEENILYGFGAAPELPDGQPVTYDEGGQLYAKRYPFKVYGLAFALTRVLVEDGDHISLGSKYSKHLAQAMQETLEILHANDLNRAFNGSYTGGDGVSLVSSAHPVIGGTQSNLLTSAALSQTSLEQALTTIAQARDSRNKQIRLTPKQMIVHATNMLNAEVILNSVLRSGTANNDINPIKSTGMVAKATVNHRLTSTSAWFIQNGVADGLKTLWRRKIEKAMEGDFETDSMRYKSTMRLAHGWTDWRDIYGNQGV